MIKALKLVVILTAALLLQVTLLPRWVADPFQPNLLIVFVVYLGLRGGGRADWTLVLLLGLIQDSFSGIYLGLHGFCYLLVYLFLKSVADRVYADSSRLVILMVFIATVVTGLLQILLLSMFSAAPGIYASIFYALVPQGLVSALAASVMVSFPLFPFLEKHR
ncbi:rod shape-determining protein MreD [Geobacter sp. DSM 9736]|uniref:rod shape-determining protein MreD n=1 Tax=Geobacter sp. DSM 9736 TaxID=1277350 RepID=UPI000B50953C|nr:rod shape-determining protein MreD [Geobacter sp. DSM 9736]SNB44694.1 rod shape-determining protein MreD [Geobacter sp. DSM 9736]